tara:strand:- start:245 stop:892 length:648 start_codon:yes stop_codon:yes gene_type:complete
MSFKNKYLFLSLLSISVLLIILVYIYLQLSNRTSSIINFEESGINSNFEIEITKNINDINDFISNYPFIKSFNLKKREFESIISINLKIPFAKNNINQEIIFKDSTIASYNFFNQNFINSINLIDISPNTLKINSYLKKSFEELQNIFDINQIEYIDDRRYDLYLKDNTKVMLPKKIDQKLLIFLENNYDLLKKNSNFEEYMDLRNFHEKTIRAK